MAQVIQIKRSTTSAAPSSSLAAGEPAYSSNSDKLFLGHPDGTTGNIVIGGKLYVDMLDHTAGTLTADSALVVDSSSKIDVLNVDNITLDGNAITSTDTNGNLTLTPNGTGDLVLDGLNWPQADGTAGQYLKTDGSGQLSWDTVTTSFTISDGTNSDTFSTGGTLSFTAGTGISITVSDDEVTIASSDTSTPVTLNAAVTDVLSLSGQEISAVDNGSDALIGWDDSAGTLTYLSAADVRTAIGVDASGTDNSTDVTLTGSYDYLTISGQAITLGQIDLTTDVTGALPNANLANSSVTLGSTSVSLGDTAASLAGLTNVTATGTITGGTITDGTASLSSGSITSAVNGTFSGTVTGGTITDGTASFTSGALTGATTGAFSSDVTIGGNLTVSGTTTTINSETLTVDDNIIVLNNNVTGSPTENAGLEIERGTATNVYFRWNETSDKWQFSDSSGTAEDILSATNFETLVPTLEGGSF